MAKSLLLIISSVSGLASVEELVTGRDLIFMLAALLLAVVSFQIRQKFIQADKLEARMRRLEIKLAALTGARNAEDEEEE